MRRGCVSLGNIRCGECQRVIQHSQRYLVIEEPGTETSMLCADCSLERGYAHYKEEKGERVLTFFAEE